MKAMGLAGFGLLFLAGACEAGKNGGTSNKGNDDGARQVVINQVTLDAETLQALDQYLQRQTPDGRYWYDPTSGLWGYEGGPVAGALDANLQLGGPLRADASGGDTGVFINGRELHETDVAGLQGLFGQVAPGRYWLNDSGIGGVENQPASFDLVAAVQQQQQAMQGVAQPPPQQRSSVLSSYDLTGLAVIGDDSGPVGIIGSDFGVTFGPGGPTYSGGP